jgi:ElaB/YqjD/DUF883 family membrane-anchored ribosome-binding protein
MDDEAEMIRTQMLETRTALTEKFEAIEDKVTHTVEAVTDTVDAVKDAVEGTMNTMTGAAEDAVASVKEAFDINRQVAAHPWGMLGGAVAAGFAGGWLLQQVSLAARSPRRPLSSGAAPEPRPSPAAAPTPNWLGEMETALEPVLHRVKGLAIGTTLGLLGQMILPSVPEAYRSQASEVVDQLTTALGGERIEGLRPQEQRSA